MKYSDGNEVRTGDEVDFNGGGDQGVVVQIWTTKEDATAFGARGPGILVRAPRFGLVEYGPADIKDDGMVLLRRRADGRPKSVGDGSAPAD